MTRKLPTKLRALQASLTEAVTQARLAYSFSPGSYTLSALNACLLADKNFRAFVATLSPQTAGSDAAQRLEREGALEARGSTSTEPSADPRPAGTKAGPKVRRPLETAASQYRVQVSQFLPGADETRQPRDGETRQRAMHEPPCL
jgi:hypothetical protein